MAANQTIEPILGAIREQVSLMQKDVNDLKLAINGNAFLDVPGVILRIRGLESRMALLVKTADALEEQEAKIDVLSKQVTKVNGKIDKIAIALVVVAVVSTLNLMGFAFLLFVAR